MKNIFEDLDEEELTDRVIYRRCSNGPHVSIWDDGQIIISWDNWMTDSAELLEIARKSKMFCSRRVTYKEHNKNV